MASPIFYFSGGGGRGVWQPTNEFILKNQCARLVSFAYPGVAKDFLGIQQELAVPSTVLVDSGAFTAWSKGTEVDRDGLAGMFDTFCSSPGITAYLINLDRIPGRKGVDPTLAEVDAAMLESEENYRWLSARFPGRVLPVYHQGEPVDYLRQLAGEAEYICLSPRNDLHEKLRVAWSQEMHARIPGKWTHGLATTGFTMLQTVPWYSVDSATWVMIAAYGGILVPRGRNMRVLSFSEKSGNIKEFDGHFRNLAPGEREVVVALLEAGGFTVESLERDALMRGVWNIYALRLWLSAVEVSHVHQPGLFE